MIALHPSEAVRGALAVQSSRPATSTLLDTDDARLVVFRIAPAQHVPAHRSDSTVLISVLRGTGIISGAQGERECAPGDLMAFEPGEIHGMRALDEPFHLLAVITPRPGTRNAEARSVTGHTVAESR